MKPIPFFALVLSLGCSQGPKAPADTIPSERVFSGTIPCSDCEGIHTKVVIRNAGHVYTYLLTEQFDYAEGPAKTIRDSGTIQIMSENINSGGDTVFWLNRPNAGDDRYFRKRGDDSLEQVSQDGRSLGDWGSRILLRSR